MGMLDQLKRWMGGAPKQSAARAPAPKWTPEQLTGSPAKTTPEAARSRDPYITNTFRAMPSPDADTPETVVPEVATAEPAPVMRRGPERRTKDRVNPSGGTRVLIIDDSPTIVALLKRLLEQSGYNAIGASDAETGLMLALSEEPDLIFLDIVLPGMNGFEALRRLRREPSCKDTPIIMISGNELATEQFYAQRIGADDFMKKPFSRNEVFVRIERLLDEDKVLRRHVAPGAVAAAAAPRAIQS